VNEPNLRQRIIDVATELFAEQGYSATSMRQVVEACSCSKPSLYYYFANKESLFSEVVGIHIRATDGMIEEMANKSGPARDCIHETLAEFADWAANNPAAMRLLQRVETQHEEGAPSVNIARAREMHIRVMQDQLERGKARGEIRADIDAFEGALVIAGILSFQFEMCLANESWDRERLHRTIDMIFNGIASV